MDWFPMFNSLRVAAISTVAVFFLGLLAAHRVVRLPSPLARGVWDVVLTLPLVLPPTVLGWLLLRFLGPYHVPGYWIERLFGVRLVMTWWSAVFASALVSFPLMYRTARAAFEHFDHDLSDAARTLGRSDMWTFWFVQVPVCGQGIFAGAVLSFVRALGEYGATYMVAGYTPGHTATVATTVYQLWRANDAGVAVWVLLNLVLSVVFLAAVSALEQRAGASRKGGETL